MAGTRLVEVAFGEPSGCLRQPSQRGREAAGQGGRHENATGRARRGPTAARRPVTLARARRAEGVRVGQLDPERVRREDATAAVILAPADVVLLELAGRRRRLERQQDRGILARREGLRLAVEDVLPERDPDVRLAEPVGDEPLLGRIGELLEDAGIDLVVEPDDRAALRRRLGQRIDVLGDRLRALLEICELLAAEVVVEAVDDEDGDETQGQGDDRQEGEGQPALESPREEPAQAHREADTPRITLSARRRRSRHLGPSARTSAMPGRLRSCRADG